MLKKEGVRERKHAKTHHFIFGRTSKEMGLVFPYCLQAIVYYSSIGTTECHYI